MPVPKKITLIAPKGPLYRHRGGIFGKSPRYRPLTLTTLSTLVPPELGAEITLIDESIGEIPAALAADLVGMTVISGTAPRAYALSKRLRAEGKTVVLDGPHVTLNPDEAAREADAVVVGYAEESWPEFLRDFAQGRTQARYDRATDFILDRPVFPERHRFTKGKFPTQAVFEASRACVHACELRVSPAAWGRRQVQKPVEHMVEDIRRTGTNKALFVDLNLVSDRRYAEALFKALIQLNIRWYGLATSLIGRDPALMALMARSGCRGLLIGFETISEAGPGAIRMGFSTPALYAAFIAGLHRFAALTPFPGMPLFNRLQQEHRLLSEAWWLDRDCLYNDLPFLPEGAEPGAIRKGCLAARHLFYAWRGIARRGLDRVNLGERVMAKSFLPINLMHCFELDKRDRFPLGDPGFRGELMCAT